MKRALTTAALLLASEQTVLAQSRLSFSGIGPIVFGSKLEQASKAINEAAPSKSADDGECRYIHFDALPGVDLMVENGVITRADVSPSVKNSLGLRVGMTLISIKHKFPSATVTRHQYDPTGHYVTIFSADKKSAFVLEEGNGVITEVRAGLLPSVQYVERCL